MQALPPPTPCVCTFESMCVWGCVFMHACVWFCVYVCIVRLLMVLSNLMSKTQKVRTALICLGYKNLAG